MGYVPTAPQGRRSPDRFRRDTEATIRRLDRKRVQPQPVPPLVRLDQREEWWAPGTAWLDTTQDL